MRLYALAPFSSVAAFRSFRASALSLLNTFSCDDDDRLQNDDTEDEEREDDEEEEEEVDDDDDDEEEEEHDEDEDEREDTGRSNEDKFDERREADDDDDEEECRLECRPRPLEHEREDVDEAELLDVDDDEVEELLEDDDAWMGQTREWLRRADLPRVEFLFIFTSISAWCDRDFLLFMLASSIFMSPL